MYLRLIFLSEFLLFLVVKSSWALSCVPCEAFVCPEVNCVGGMALHPCGCCHMCAKQKGESCGGVFGLSGTCDEGLRCIMNPVPEEESEVLGEGFCADSSDVAVTPVPLTTR